MRVRRPPITADPIDASLVHAIHCGLPLVPEPYAAIADDLGIPENQVIERLAGLLESGTIKRFGVVVRHHELGYSANAMVVWALPEERVDELGHCIGRFPFVTLSYRRPRRPPDWPYNLFTMIHGKDREAVMDQVEQIKQCCGLCGVDSAVLFSGQRFKQRGARYGNQGSDVPSPSRGAQRPLDPIPRDGNAS